MFITQNIFTKCFKMNPSFYFINLLNHQVLNFITFCDLYICFHIIFFKN